MSLIHLERSLAISQALLMIFKVGGLIHLAWFPVLCLPALLACLLILAAFALSSRRKNDERTVSTTGSGKTAQMISRALDDG